MASYGIDAHRPLADADDSELPYTEVLTDGNPLAGPRSDHHHANADADAATSSSPPQMYLIDSRGAQQPLQPLQPSPSRSSSLHNPVATGQEGAAANGVMRAAMKEGNGSPAAPHPASSESLGLQGQPNSNRRGSSQLRSSSTSHLPPPTARAGDSSATALPFPASTGANSISASNLHASVPASSHRQCHLASSTASRSSNNPDAIHIQNTYARISAIGGIPRDGFVDGVELTRERRTEGSISSYLSPFMGSIGAFGGEDTGTEAGEAGPSSLGEGPQRSAHSLAPPAQGRTPLNGSVNGHHRPRKASARSAVSTQEEQDKELELLKRVDRYGFFAPTYSQAPRLVLLSRDACRELPPEKAIGGGKRSKRSSLTSAGTLASPYLYISTGHTPAGSADGSASQDSSRRSSTQPHNALGASFSSSSLAASGRGVPPGSGQAGPSSRALPDNVSVSTSYSAKENSRADKWYLEMLVPSERDSGGNILAWRLKPGESERKLLRRVIKGIPDRWRAAAWEALISHRRAQYASKGKVRAQEQGQGHELDDAGLRRRFFELILEPSDHDVQIDLDVPRTISGHLYFHTRYGLGQRSLFNVLHCFALLCPDCGYCQGMGSLAATFLCYLPPERAYAAMVRLHDTYDMHAIFSPGFPGMLECFYVQEKLVQTLMPEVHEVFEKNYITISSFATKWYITLFANGISFSTQLRIWDAFLLEGKDVLILVPTAIIWVLRRHFISPQADFESILSMLSSFFVPEDEDALLRWVGKMLKRGAVREQMEAWKQEWRAEQKKMT